MSLYDNKPVFKMKEFFIYLTYDPETELEGMIAVGFPPLPLMTSSRENADKMLPDVQNICTEHNITVRLARFSNKEILDTVTAIKIGKHA